jgi:hypothetical protein
VVVVAEDRVDAVARAQRREPARAVSTCAGSKSKMSPVSTITSGASRWCARPCGRAAALEPVADVQVADLHDAQAGEIRCSFGSGTRVVVTLDALLPNVKPHAACAAIARRTAPTARGTRRHRRADAPSASAAPPNERERAQLASTESPTISVATPVST